MTEIIRKIPFQVIENNIQKSEILIVHVTSFSAQSDRQAVHLIQLKKDDVFDFLFVVEITESYFFKIKELKGLVFNHSGFPEYFIKQLELTKSENTAFLIVQDNSSESKIRITKKNEFQTLDVLELNVYCVDDKSKSEYMKKQIKEWKEKSLFSDVKIQELEKRLNLQDVFFLFFFYYLFFYFFFWKMDNFIFIFIFNIMVGRNGRIKGGK
jgi:hypothetical protein